MCVQAAALAESLVTSIAGERAVASVAAEVSLEIALLRKGACAGVVGAGLLRVLLESIVLVCLLGCECEGTGTRWERKGKERRKRSKMVVHMVSPLYEP
jgi:hypothetical protein